MRYSPIIAISAWLDSVIHKHGYRLSMWVGGGPEMFPFLNLEMQSRIMQTEAPRFSPCRNGQITPTDRLARSRFRRVAHSPRFLMFALLSPCPSQRSPVPGA